MIQTLPIRRNHAVVRIYGDRPTVHLGSTSAPLCNFGEEIMNSY